MKKKILFSVALICNLFTMQAANTVVVPDVTIPRGGTGVISVELNNDKEYTAFSMKLTLPEGVSLVSVSKGSRMVESHSLSGNAVTGMITCLSTANEVFTGTSGELFTITVSANDALAIGTILAATLTEVNFSTTSGEEALANASFDITIGENRMLLDENSTIAPEASGGDVNVLVRRTISAGNWSTIVLPFAMTTAQMKEAFGNDVQLANFTGYEAEEDDGGDIVGITVKFASANAIEANHPYIIKVSKAITEFTVDNVDVDPEDEPTVATVKRTRKAWSELIGTYVANTEVPSKTLFLNSNKFYYSTGSTKMKGYRAYFDFYDVLTDVDDNYEVKMYINEIETKVEGLNVLDAEGHIYDLSGRKVSKPQRGVYIVNGKKALIK